LIQFSILDLQAISNISNQLFRIKNERVDMKQAVSEVINSNRLQANKKKQRIYTNYDSSVPDQLMCDRLRVQQIVNNLLSNAIKFSDEKM
jgi:two-component system, sensor histidine kinase and response regulator